jgi:exosortase
MSRLITRSSLLIAIQCGAFYPVWSWSIRRMADGSDEPWGLLALATAVIATMAIRPSAQRGRVDLTVPAVLTLAYAVLFPWVPRLVGAGIAMAALGTTLSVLRTGRPLRISLLGLLMLALPVIASLQFYLGYPLRVLSGMGASLLLQITGIPVVLEGTCLRLGSELISIDAPCSGIRMLWAGLYVVFAAAAVLDLDNLRTTAAAFIAVPVLVAANALRSASLFFGESGMLPFPQWGHEAVGLILFGVTTGVLVRTVQLMGPVKSFNDRTVSL